MRPLKIGHRKVGVSPVFASFWHVAAERQRVYHARLRGDPAPWTDDPVIGRYRFTNAYRAADRVSQQLIRIAYAGPQTPENLVLRVLLFRLFNRPSTWAALEGVVDEITVETFDVELFSNVLDGLHSQGQRVYSAAYIMPAPDFGAVRKHRNHMLLVEHMLRSGAAQALASAHSLKEVFDTIRAYPTLGPFLAYQLAVDFNYTALTDFDENDFVVAGPGARRGIAKCFPDLHGLSPEDVIRWMMEAQHEQFAAHGLAFQDLFGRALSLVDCQNLFCETDKYARVTYPQVSAPDGRGRIKQRFTPYGVPDTPFFPPKWGINEAASPAQHPCGRTGSS